VTDAGAPAPGPRFWPTFGAGAWHGVRAFLKLMVVVAPVFTAMTVLKHTPVLEGFARFMAPLMRYFHLPGEAAMALILGNFINLYASLGAVVALQLPGPQFTVLSLMLLISHSQVLETAVFFQIRAKWWLLWFIRLVVSFGAGTALGALLVPGTAVTGGAVATGAARLTVGQAGAFRFGPFLADWVPGLLGTAVKMLLVLVGIFVLLELGRRYGVLEKLLARLGRAIRFMGYRPEAGMPWLAGNVFGIVFGAGLIVESVSAGGLASKQVTLVATFLALCHGLFEDTAIFMVQYPGGSALAWCGHLFWILVPRMVLAAAVTRVLSQVLREKPAAGAAGSGAQGPGAG